MVITIIGIENQATRAVLNEYNAVKNTYAQVGRKYQGWQTFLVYWWACLFRRNLCFILYAPVPLEETGSRSAFKYISGVDLPGISKWAGNFFVAFDSYFRSDFSSSASPSQFLNILGYALINACIGLKLQTALSFMYGAAGNAGQYDVVL